MYRWVDVWVGGLIGGWMYRWVDVWVGGLIGGWMYRWWTYGWVD